MNLRRAACRLYETSPAYWVSRLAVRFRRRFPEDPTQIERRIREEAHWSARAPVIQRVVERVRLGEALEDVLGESDAPAGDGKEVEYGFLVSWLLDCDPGQNLLDIGCLLRNRFTASILRDHCTHVWHCGPVFHRDAMDGDAVHYQLFDFERSFGNGDVFPLVVCLSTLEHVGYAHPKQGHGAPRCRAVPSFGPVEEALQAIARLTAPGGRLLLSVPCGTPEVRIDPQENDLVGQVWDGTGFADAVRVLEDAGIAATVSVFHRSQGRWRRADGGEEDSGSAGDISGVAFIEGSRGEG